ncbi:hypothetical protein RJ639_045050 [Escallonia herrerae]|uniref:Pentatricopeptide repeat-containing protein n=1 Tax=Escallonia herrerae TaxID=1293975 RepID=A0AA88WG44_9ASTE|nr:hypothetical protein RJ639_045050 [Escallonia herrerae]
MALRSKLRLTALQTRHFSSSSILNPNSTTPLTGKEKSRAALSLIKLEKNPTRILDICRAASLTPEFHLDRIVFSIAVEKLTESSHFEGIRTFVEELKTRPDLKTERFFAHAIVLYGQAGLLENARQTFDEMPKLGVGRTAKSLNALLFSCIVGKKYDEVRSIFIEFPTKYAIEPDLDTYNTVIKAFCESGSSSSVYSVLAEMERKGVKPNATSFDQLIAGFYREEKFDDVGKVLEMMKKRDMSVGITTYNTRIKSLCKLKRTVEAKALVDGMISRGMKLNSVTYSHLVHGFCKEGNVDEAKKLFKEMRSKGCQPDSNCYFTLIYFLCKGEEFETAWQVLKECMEKNWVPNFSTMKLLVNGLASVSKVDEALEIVGQMKEKFSTNADQWTEIEEALASRESDVVG